MNTQELNLFLNYKMGFKTSPIKTEECHIPILCTGEDRYCNWELKDYVGSLDMIHQVELSIWREPELVEEYEEELQRIYLEQVGYQGCGYWFMASAATRAKALVRVLGI